MNLNYIFDFMIRALTLGGRFVLLISIAKYLSANDVGVYGIFGSLISYILYFLGLDFYIYSTRKIIDDGIDRLWSMIFNQTAFFALNYILFISFSKAIFSFSGIPDFLFLGVLITLLEHLSQEIYRILIAVKKIRLANIQLFVRSGWWCYVVAILLYTNIITNLNKILELWAASGIISVVFGFAVLYKTAQPNATDFKLDIFWIKEGIKVSAFFFIGTICLRGIFYFDKILLQTFVGFELIGVYVFYFGIAAAIQSFVDILVVSRYFPDLMKQINLDLKAGDMVSSRNLLEQFKKKIIVTGFILSMISIPACYIVTTILNKTDYINNYSLYLTLLLSNIIFLASMPYHYFLYAVKRDSLLVIINAVTFFVFLVMSFLLISINSNLGVYAIIISVIVAYMSSLLIKFKAYKDFIKVYL